MQVLIASHGGEPYADQDDQIVEAALIARGIPATTVWWADPEVDWAGADLVVVRSTWDYFDRRDEYLAWARAVEEHTPLENSAAVLAWNTHKGYLAELEQRGAPIVPTAFLGQGDRIDLAQLLDARGWPDAVIKPAVAGGSDGLRRVGRASEDVDGDQAFLDDLLAAGDVLLQPFVPSVRDGELSLVLFDGQVSHAVRKVPADGEIRVQVEFGGDYARVVPPPEAEQLATWLLEASGHQYLYARVDLLADDDGSWMLAELEVTEPSLYLNTVPEATELLVDAIVRRLSGSAAPNPAGTPS